MPATINLLTDKSGLYSDYKSASGGTIFSEGTKWSLTGGVLEYIPTEFLSKNRIVIRIAPSGSGPVVLTLENDELLSGIGGKNLSFNAKVKPLSQCVVSTQIGIDGQLVSEPSESRIPGGVYSAVNSNLAQVPNDDEQHTAIVQMTFTRHNGANIFVTYPNLIDDEAFYRNIYVPLIRQYMPDFYWEIDAAQKRPSYPLHRFIDVLTTVANEVYQEYTAMYPYERRQIGSPELLAEIISKSVLVDPFAVREKYVPWLSQFVGFSTRRNIPSAQGQPFFESYPLEKAFADWQLATSYYGRAGGTRQSMISAVERVLLKTKDDTESTFAIALTSNYQNDEWQILIRTIENETPDASIGEESLLVLTAVEPARPLGYKVIHETVDLISFILDDLSFGILDESNLGSSGVPTGAPEDLTSETESGPIYDVLGSGTSVTFYAQNSFLAGSSVTITGVTPSVYNYSNVVVTSATSDTFTVAETDSDLYVSGGSAICTESTSTDSVRIWFTPLYVNGYDGGGVVTNYVYFLSTNGGSTYGPGSSLSPAKGSPPITITGLSGATNYSITLKAVNDAGESSVISSPYSFTTK